MKGNFILDLDQTLISAEAMEEFDAKKYKSKAKKFTFYDMDGYYIVFERPGLQDFLNYLFDNYNVAIWTAASKDYALFVVDKIILAGKKDRKLDYIFFSYHCDISKTKKNSSKDLSILWEEFQLQGYNRQNTVILDDYNEVYNTQPKNCIIASPFEFTDENSDRDTFLYDLQQFLTKNVSNANTIVKIVENINQQKK